jgi:hypothetical protein
LNVNIVCVKADALYI